MTPGGGVAGIGRRVPKGTVVAPETASREAKRVDFKRSLDIENRGEWIEVIKDIVSMANSGGGALVFGVSDDGTPSGEDCAPLLALDSAKIVDKIAPLVGLHFADFEVRPAKRDGKRIAVIEVQAVFPPMVFVQEGAYEVTSPDGKRRKVQAFARGTVYFRHGAKSEPANAHDLKHVYDRQAAIDRRAMLADMVLAGNKPKGMEIQFVPGELSKPGDGKAMPFRLTNDPAARVVRGLDQDRTWPFRQTEVLAALNERLKPITGHDVQCVRKAYGIDGKPEYSHQPKFGSRQYSEAFVNWMVENATSDRKFFTTARKKVKLAR